MCLFLCLDCSCTRGKMKTLNLDRGDKTVVVVGFDHDLQSDWTHGSSPFVDEPAPLHLCTFPLVTNVARLRRVDFGETYGQIGSFPLQADSCCGGINIGNAQCFNSYAVFLSVYCLGSSSVLLKMEIDGELFILFNHRNVWTLWQSRQQFGDLE